MRHKSVLLKEAVSVLLEGHPNGTFVDGTLGAGGHSEALLEGGAALVIGIDKDEGATLRAGERLKAYGEKVEIIHGSFGNMESLLDSRKGIIDGIILDLGFSSDQLEDSGRGLSFQKDEPLLMNLGTGVEAPKESAYEIVNSWRASDIESILREYGDERHARKIAETIVTARKKKAITTSGELAELIQGAIGRYMRHFKIHPATKTFQALRIAVNDEYGEIKRGIEGALALLKSGGRLSVITFHSGEDRIVKHAFLALKNSDAIQILTKKPIVPGDEEVENNRRARSAKLRTIEKI